MLTRLEEGGGSSPHTRGAPVVGWPGWSRGGIIPAYAGSTSPAPAGQGPAPDHPRIRGEHCGRRAGRGPAGGSSPHTRGALCLHRRHRARGRIIPAYAGSTPERGPEQRGPPDHPRIRGEHLLTCRLILELAGSSPHTRGARRRCRHSPHSAGIIPAYAGSTSWERRRRVPAWDHPRIRGEHTPRRSARPPQEGSSPHTRGAPKGAWGGVCRAWIIPAYAGSTKPITSAPPPNSGSSPHTRGAPILLGIPAAPVGIIPAYAGSTSRR